jgi:hypothetical protein
VGVLRTTSATARCLAIMFSNDTSCAASVKREDRPVVLVGDEALRMIMKK